MRWNGNGLLAKLICFGQEEGGEIELSTSYFLSYPSSNALTRYNAPGLVLVTKIAASSVYCSVLVYDIS